MCLSRGSSCSPNFILRAHLFQSQLRNPLLTLLAILGGLSSPRSTETPSSLDCGAVCAFEAEEGAGLVGGGDVVALELEDAGDFLDLFGVGAGFLSARDVERVFETDADVATHHRGGAGDAHLLGASADGRPLVVATEEFVGGLFHKDEVVELGSDAAEDAHDELQEDGRLEVALIEAEFQVVEVADVVAFVLKFYVVWVAAELLGDHANVGEGVAEDVALRGAHVVFFPALLPALVALGQRVDGEVHRAHV